MFEQAAPSIERKNSSLHARAQFAPAARVGNELKLAKRRAVFYPGDDADRFYEVESGAVMVYRLLEDGRRQIVEIVFPGGICGLAGGDVHDAACETLLPSVLRSYKIADLACSGLLRARVVAGLKSQIAAMHDHAVMLGRKTAEERVCTLILRLYEIATGNAADGTIAFPLSRTEIADYLGLTLETVCRTICDLRRRGLLEAGVKKSEVRVQSVERLRHAASC